MYKTVPFSIIVIMIVIAVIEQTIFFFVVVCFMFDMHPQYIAAQCNAKPTYLNPENS